MCQKVCNVLKTNVLKGELCCIKLKPIIQHGDIVSQLLYIKLLV